MVFGIIIFSLSLSLAKGQVIESVPSETIYAVFAGGLGVVAALLGNAAITDSSLNGPLLWIVDGVTALALFVGGVVSGINAITQYDEANLEYEDLCCSTAWN